MSRTRATGGFSLIDLIIGLFLFSIGILGVLKMQLVAMQYQGAARMRSQAIVLAEQQMENLLRADYAGLAAGSRAGSPFQVRWDIADSGSYKMIDVTVQWNDRGVKSASLASVRGDLQ